MKILLLSRPVVNAGDFLFSEKSVEAFKRICPNVEISRGHISEQYKVEYLNSFDSIVAAGGPLYDNLFLSEASFPLLAYVKEMRPQFYFLSAGWYGREASLDGIYGYKFREDVIKSLKHIERMGGYFSCRDDISAVVLRNNGLENVCMTGCTAWYDYDSMDICEPKYHKKIRKVVISDQGITKESSTWDWKYKAAEDLVATVRHMFPEADMILTFNGGIDTKYSSAYNHKICRMLEKEGVAFVDISGSSDGFGLYSDADLHVGFRVHSHIYCMSKRIPSILIGEDARGSGCNQAMGLPDIRDYSFGNGRLSVNPYLGRQVEYYIRELLGTDFMLLSGSYLKMKTIFYDAFVPFIRRICKE